VCTATGDGDPRQCWHGALTSFEVALMPADAAIARLELGRFLAADKPTVAISELDAAHDTFERIGTRRHADEAAALLRSLGGPSKIGPKLGGELTRRESEVFELLALGLTNAEIGQRLFITAKTVGHHVGRILFKLGLRSRAEAAATAARR
jgi:DNA-binding NarL/FixJ family response regulator